jgi:hypothetical protein
MFNKINDSALIVVSNMEWFAGKSLCANMAQELTKAKD